MFLFICVNIHMNTYLHMYLDQVCIKNFSLLEVYDHISCLYMYILTYICIDKKIINKYRYTHLYL